MSVGGFPTIPTVTTLNTAMFDLASLRPGQLIAAQVMQQLEGELLRLAFPQGTFDLPTKMALPVGSLVNFEVQRGPNGLTLAVISVTPPRADGAGSLRSANASTGQPAALPLATPATTTGIAGLPASAAGTAPLQHGQTAAAGVNIQQVASQLGTAQAPPGAVALAAMNTASLRRLIAPVLIAAAARQDGLAPLYANLSGLLADPALPLPPQVRDAMAQVLGMRMSGETPPSADSLRQTLAQSGLPAFSGAGAAAPDLKAALVRLEQTLGEWSRTMAPPAPTAAPAVLPPGTGLPAGIEEQLAEALAAAALEAGTEVASRPPGERATAQHAAPPVESKPPPPQRDALPHSQRPTLPTLNAEIPPQEIVARLIDQTEAALSRLQLTQLASLPADGEPPARHLDHIAHPLVVEVPIAFGQQTAVAQLRIGEEEHRAGETDAPGWVVRFSLDLEPLGPIHALVRLQGETIGVSLWAERPETSARLKDGSADLDAALSGAQLQVSEIRVKAGKPEAGPSTGAGVFVDRRT